MPATRRQLAKAEEATPSKTAPADDHRSKKVDEVVVLNPRTTEYEFMGPYVGAVGITIGLPTLVWAAAYYCNGGMWPHVPTKLPSLEDITSTFSWEAFAVYVAWWTFQAVLYLVVPGEMKEGLPLRDGSRLRYPINGFRCLLITAVAAALVHVYVHPLTWIADNFVQLTVAAIVFSYGLSVYLYFASFLGGPRAILALGGNSGVPLYDFFIGRELNPRVLGGRLDLKYFCELRPGLFGWVLINTAMLLRQVETQGAVSPAMAIVYALQALYVADSVYCEDCILSTIDIIQDGFGFMLVFGDLAWVPCMYSLQARYLAEVPVHLTAPYAALCLAVGVAGFYVFRAANAQKDTFKKNPEDAAVKGACVEGREAAREGDDG